MDNSSEDPAGGLYRMARPASSPSAVSRGRSTIAQSHSRPVPRPRQRSPAQRSMSESYDHASVTEAPHIQTSASADGHLPVGPIFFSTKSDQVPVEAERANIADLQHKIEDLQTEIAFVSAQAEAYKDDFQQERKDRESAHGKLIDFKEQTAAHVNRMETRIFELERENNELKQLTFDRSRFDQLQEDYQISQSQIISYKKQMDIYKKELENGKRKNEELISELAQKHDYQQPAPESFPDSEDSYEIPLDPNLICPKCGKQFRRGEIQLLRKHHKSDCISSGDFVEENPLMKGLDADMESAALEVKRMCSFDSSKGPRQHSRQSSGEELKLNLTKQLNNMSSELTKRTGDQTFVKYFDGQIQSMKQYVNVAVERMEQGFATLRREIEQTFLKSTDKAANKTLDEHFHDLSSSPFDPNGAADLLMSRGELQDTRFTARQLHSEDVILAVMASGQGAFRTLVKILMKQDHNRPLCRSLIATYRARGGLWMDPLLPLDHTNAMRELSRFDRSTWRMLGGSLEVPFFKLNEFASFIAGRPTGQYDALAYTVDYWLNNDLDASWDKLASAVEKCGDAVRASSIRENVGIAPTAAVPPARMKTPNSPTANPAKLSEIPTLDDLVLIETRDSTYPIPEMVASGYRHFAAYLLQDKDGRIVRQLEIKHGGRKSDIVFDVLAQWVIGSGRECNWRTFLSGLKACGLATESDHIKHYLTH